MLTMDTLSDAKDEINPNAENAQAADKQPAMMIVKEDIENLSLLEIELCQDFTNFSEYVPNLINLCFSNNQFSVSLNFVNMIKQLTYLDPSYNKFYSLPNASCELNNLRKPSAYEHQLAEVQNKLNNVLNLKISNLNRNQLTDCQKSKIVIACMTGLTELNMCIASIPIMPKEHNVYNNLCNINISSNHIYFLPEEICSLKHLNTLILDKNYITSLPENIGQLTSLRQLKVRDNSLHKLPESMQSLQELEYMDLYSNKLSMMPNVIPDLTSLIGLDLEQNYFSTEHLKYVGCPNYEAMRLNLKNLWPDMQFGYQSFCGYKSNPCPDENESLSLLSRSSSNCSSEEEPAVSLLSPETYNELLHKPWDTSDDSMDEFDPNENREPKKRTYPPFTFFKPFQKVYCPADLHQARVITRIRQMLKDGTLVWPSIYEDGQFDDA